MTIQKISIKNVFLTILITSFVFFVTLTSFKPLGANALSSKYFGGMKTATLTCTCSGNQLIYVKDYASNRVLALVYNSGAKLYSKNNIYGMYLLGSYSSGGQCKMTAGDSCIDVPSDGQFSSSPGVGTS